MKYSIFTVSLPDLSPNDALREMKSAGYEGVEWRVVDQKPSTDGKPSFWSGNLCTWPLKTFIEDAGEIRRITESAGFEMPNVGTYVNCENLEAVNTAMTGAAKAGAKQLRVGVPGYDPKNSFLEIRDRALCQYREVEELAREHDVRALIEIHVGNITPSASGMAAFVRHFDPAHVGAIYDSGNVVCEGYEQYRMGLELLGPYLAHVHLKNTAWQPVGTRPDGSAEWEAVDVPFQKGIANFAVFFQALKSVGYDGWISFEDFSTERSTLEKLRENIAFIRGIEKSIS